MSGHGVFWHGFSLFGMDTSKNEDASQKRFWFNLKTLKVEEGLKSAAPYRVGPFETRQEAASALELLRRRSQEWEDQEKSDQ